MLKNLYNLFPPLVHFPGDLLPRVQTARLHQKSAALVAEIESNIFGNVLGGLENKLETPNKLDYDDMDDCGADCVVCMCKFLDNKQLILINK